MTIIKDILGHEDLGGLDLTPTDLTPTDLAGLSRLAGLSCGAEGARQASACFRAEIRARGETCSPLEGDWEWAQAAVAEVGDLDETLFERGYAAGWEAAAEAELAEAEAAEAELEEKATARPLTGAEARRS